MVQAQLSGRAPNSLVPAGEDVEVLVTLRDRYGNPSDKLTGSDVDIRAVGPDLVSFSATAPNRFRLIYPLSVPYTCSVVCCWYVFVVLLLRGNCR